MVARNRTVEEIQLSINHGSSIVTTDIGHDDKDMALAAGLSSEEELFVGKLDVHPFTTKRFFNGDRGRALDLSLIHI